MSYIANVLYEDNLNIDDYDSDDSESEDNNIHINNEKSSKYNSYLAYLSSNTSKSQ